MDLGELQGELVPWTEHNFPDAESWHALLGVQEEAGELAHAHLKAVQGIRTNEDHRAQKIDAVADIVIFLANYCNLEGINMTDAVAEAWAEVKKRDWRVELEGTARP